MSNSKPEKKLRITTPAGIAKFVFVDKPSTKFKKEGKYSVDLVLTKDEVKAIREQVLPIAKKAVEDGMAKFSKDPKALKKFKADHGDTFKLTMPITPELDEAGEETGAYVIKAGKDAQFTGRDDKVINVTIPVFDTSKPPKPVTGLKIGRGSKLKVSFDVIPYSMVATGKAGVSFRLAGVQVIDLVEYTGGGSAESMGFSGEEGGFQASESSGSGEPSGGGSGDENPDF